MISSFGELSGRAAILRLLNYTVKKSVGYIPWKGQSRANTSLTFHAGEVVKDTLTPYSTKSFLFSVMRSLVQLWQSGT